MSYRRSLVIVCDDCKRQGPKATGELPPSVFEVCGKAETEGWKVSVYGVKKHPTRPHAFCAECWAIRHRMAFATGKGPKEAAALPAKDRRKETAWK